MLTFSHTGKGLAMPQLISADAMRAPFRGLLRQALASPGKTDAARQPEGIRLIVEQQKQTFNAAAFLASTGLGRRIVHFRAKEALFSQGDEADSVFYLQKGRAKVTVVSQAGKEATITLVIPGEFVGEGALAADHSLRLSTATTITACVALKIGREEMIRVMHEEHEFSDLFLKFLLQRSIRIQADLVDQLFNSSEKRLARILLLMAEFGQAGEPTQFIPKISQETLAEMIGTTRSRVSFFMNRFRKLGLIDYSGRIKVHKSLLNVILHDRFPWDDSQTPDMQSPESKAKPARARNSSQTDPF